MKVNTCTRCEIGLTEEDGVHTQMVPEDGERGEFGDIGEEEPLPPLERNDFGSVKKEGTSLPLASHRWVLSFTEILFNSYKKRCLGS